MTRSRFTAIAAACLLLPAAGALPAGVLDDAGSGGDAGDTPADALALSYGSYTGNLTPQDADWYTFPANAGLSCLDLELLSSHAMRVGFGAGGSSTLVNHLAEGAFHSVVAVGGGVPRLAALPDEAPWDAASVGTYRFGASSAAATLRESKENEAPTSPTGAPMLPAPCFRGQFRGDGSDTDVFAFAIGTADVVTYSLAQAGGAGANLTIVDANNVPLAPTILAGEVAQVQLPQAGVYYASATGFDAPEGSSYALAIFVGPDPGSGCRPMCVGAE